MLVNTSIENKHLNDFGFAVNKYAFLYTMFYNYIINNIDGKSYNFRESRKIR